MSRSPSQLRLLEPASGKKPSAPGRWGPIFVGESEADYRHLSPAELRTETGAIELRMRGLLIGTL